MELNRKQNVSHFNDQARCKWWQNCITKQKVLTIKPAVHSFRVRITAGRLKTNTNQKTTKDTYITVYIKISWFFILFLQIPSEVVKLYSSKTWYNNTYNIVTAILYQSKTKYSLLLFYYFLEYSQMTHVLVSMLRRRQKMAYQTSARKTLFYCCFFFLLEISKATETIRVRLCISATSNA